MNIDKDFGKGIGIDIDISSPFPHLFIFQVCHFIFFYKTGFIPKAKDISK